ncbi:hypothetical protein PR048_010875 [Dryococelus australis]|uniref:Uncharacterized protein n=1 Tax=Dryococelus australis TaxID=614101 RepID=A0ABQ9I3Y0_9NEOP|nr:hypothetical protein PR048_010875 [Dryococelus australis]
MVLKHTTNGCADKKIQSSVAKCFSSAKRRKADIEHLALRTTEAFAKANIHLQKLDGPNIRIAIIKLFVLPGSGDMPCVKTLREKYVPKLSEGDLKNVKEIIKDKQGRYVYVILFQVLPEPVGEPLVIVSGQYPLEFVQNIFWILPTFSGIASFRKVTMQELEPENTQQASDCAARGIFPNTFENSSVLKKLNIKDIAHVKHICQEQTADPHEQ